MYLRIQYQTVYIYIYRNTFTFLLSELIFQYFYKMNITNGSFLGGGAVKSVPNIPNNKNICS